MVEPPTHLLSLLFLEEGINVGEVLVGGEAVEGVGDQAGAMKEVSDVDIAAATLCSPVHGKVVREALHELRVVVYEDQGPPCRSKTAHSRCRSSP